MYSKTQNKDISKCFLQSLCLLTYILLFCFGLVWLFETGSHSRFIVLYVLSHIWGKSRNKCGFEKADLMNSIRACFITKQPVQEVQGNISNAQLDTDNIIYLSCPIVKTAFLQYLLCSRLLLETQNKQPRRQAACPIKYSRHWGRCI